MNVPATRRQRVFQLGLLALLVMASQCCADLVVLRDGTEYEGEITRDTNESLTVLVRWAGMRGSVVVPKAEVVRVEIRPLRQDSVVAQAQKLVKDAEAAAADPRKAAEAWVTVGEYYQRHHGYSAQAREAFQQALLFDNDQPTARENLGYVKSETGWVEKPKPEAKVTIGPRRNDVQQERRLAQEQGAQRRDEALEQVRIVERVPENVVYVVGGYGPSPYSYGDSGVFVLDPAPWCPYPYYGGIYGYGPGSYWQPRWPNNTWPRSPQAPGSGGSGGQVSPPPGSLGGQLGVAPPKPPPLPSSHWTRR